MSQYVVRDSTRFKFNAISEEHKIAFCFKFYEFIHPNTSIRNRSIRSNQKLSGWMNVLLIIVVRRCFHVRMKNAFVSQEQHFVYLKVVSIWKYCNIGEIDIINDEHYHKMFLSVRWTFLFSIIAIWSSKRALRGILQERQSIYWTLIFLIMLFGKMVIT